MAALSDHFALSVDQAPHHLSELKAIWICLDDPPTGLGPLFQLRAWSSGLRHPIALPPEGRNAHQVVQEYFALLSITYALRPRLRSD